MDDKIPASEFRPDCDGVSHWWGEPREKSKANGDRLEIRRCGECGVVMIQTFTPGGALAGTRFAESPGT